MHAVQSLDTVFFRSHWNKSKNSFVMMNRAQQIADVNQNQVSGFPPRGWHPRTRPSSKADTCNMLLLLIIKKGNWSSQKAFKTVWKEKTVWKTREINKYHVTSRVRTKFFEKRQNHIVSSRKKSESTEVDVKKFQKQMPNEMQRILLCTMQGLKNTIASYVTSGKNAIDRKLHQHSYKLIISYGNLTIK